MPGVSRIRSTHIMELRERVNALRGRYGRLPFAWNGAAAAGQPVEARHIIDLRTALQTVYDAVGGLPPAYTDPSLVPGTTVIKAIHIAELRAAVLALE